MGQAENRMNPSGMTTMPDDEASLNRIKNDIDHTRAEMDETIDALSERLAPRHLMNEAMGWLRGGEGHGNRGADAAAIAKNLGAKTWEHAKRHPVSSALIGAGIAWMLIEHNSSHDGSSRRRGRTPRKYGGSYVDARTGEPYDEHYGSDYEHEASGGAVAGGSGKMHEVWDRAKGRASEAAHSAQASLHEMSEEAKHRAEHLRERARHTAERARQRAQERSHALNAYITGTAGSAKHYVEDAAGQMGHRVADGYQYSREKLWQAIDEYPLAVGGAALGLGLLLGLAVPRTRQEDQWIGDTADQLKDQARQAGRDAIDRGRHVVEATAAAVTDEVQKQGLTPSGMAEHGRNFVEKVGEDAKEEGMTPGSLKNKVEAVAERAKQTAEKEIKGEDDDNPREG